MKILTCDEKGVREYEPPKTRKGYKLVDCQGEAHSNPYIDSCMMCAPRWGKLEIPEHCKDDREYWDELRAIDETPIADAKRYVVVVDSDGSEPVREAFPRIVTVETDDIKTAEAFVAANAARRPAMYRKSRRRGLSKRWTAVKCEG